MVFLPSRCDRCREIALISSKRCEGRPARCESCAGSLTILPGAAYAEGDVALFNELLALVEAAGIGGIEAEYLSFKLEEARASGGDLRGLAVAAARLPALTSLAALLAVSPERARQALSMLATLLQALGKQRQSGAWLGVRRVQGLTEEEEPRESRHAYETGNLTRKVVP